MFYATELSIFGKTENCDLDHSVGAFLGYPGRNVDGTVVYELAGLTDARQARHFEPSNQLTQLRWP